MPHAAPPLASSVATWLRCTSLFGGRVVPTRNPISRGWPTSRRATARALAPMAHPKDVSLAVEPLLQCLPTATPLVVAVPLSVVSGEAM